MYTARIQDVHGQGLHEAKAQQQLDQPNDGLGRRREAIRCLGPEKSGSIASCEINSFRSLLPIAKRFATACRQFALANGAQVDFARDARTSTRATRFGTYSLVDPDNRRQVDYKRRRELLGSLATANSHDLVRDWTDGRIRCF